jgi:hypothetical protein
MARVTDAQVKELRQRIQKGSSLKKAAMKTDMDRKSARKYREGKRPSESRAVHTWRTRADPLAAVWPELQGELEQAPGLQANTLLAMLQERHPGEYGNELLRTLQRRLKRWRGTSGPAKEVFFAQVHEPGRLGASDFTHLTSLGVSIQGQPFAHLAYHFVLTYSNWEHVTLCFSESFASLSEGLQNALWALGGVPLRHRTDRMTLAVHPDGNPEVFTQKYLALLGHYGLTGEATNPASGHENGDCEQSHRQFKRALDQSLLVRGHRDFASREEYTAFLHGVAAKQNAGRRARFAEEMSALRALPCRRLEALERKRVKVGQGSTIRVLNNIYSVPARLRGEWVEAWVGADQIEVRYAQQVVMVVPRLCGQDKHRIDYRHIISWLVRKPGAFAQYCYQADLFPTSRFRQAYDVLLAKQPQRASKEYLRLLHLAARTSESGVDEALGRQLAAGQLPSALEVETQLSGDIGMSLAAAVRIEPVDLARYDELLEGTFLEPKEETHDEPGDPAGARGVLAGAAFADDAVPVSRTGPASPAGVIELRELSAGAGGARVPATASQPHRASIEGVAFAPGEEPANVRPQAVAGQSGAAGPHADDGRIRGASGERVAVRPPGQRENALLLRAGPRVGACRAAGVVHEVQLVGSGLAGGQARLDAEGSAASSGELGCIAHRRLGLRATKPRGDGSPVHAVGGAVRDGQCHGDKQPGVFEMGPGVQRPDDDGGGHRSAGASLHHCGAERAQLPRGDGQEGPEGAELSLCRVELLRPPWGAGEAPLASAPVVVATRPLPTLRLATLHQPPTAECFWQIPSGDF